MVTPRLLQGQVFGRQVQRDAAVIGAGGVEAEGDMRVDDLAEDETEESGALSIAVDVAETPMATEVATEVTTE